MKCGVSGRHCGTRKRPGTKMPSNARPALAANAMSGSPGAGSTTSTVVRYTGRVVAGYECHHCKEWVGEGEAHDCWTTTEAALTGDLSEDLRDAWERLRETAVALGEQRVYASGTCIMFSRDTCYCFVRPKRSSLEVVLFLGRAVKAPQVRRTEPRSKTKIANILKITHRDEVEAPITDWLREAYELPDRLALKARPTRAKTREAKAESKGRPSRPHSKRRRSSR
jgi:Domain of unknown function (DUF5655)